MTASARRRKWFYDSNETLAAYVASVSDTDDIVPILVAFQIEWNKIYYLLNADPTTMQLLQSLLTARRRSLRRYRRCCASACIYTQETGGGWK